LTQTGGAGVTTGGADAERSRNRAAKTSLILGILATLFAPTQFLTLIAILLAPIGAILGVMGLIASFKGAPGRRMAVSGIPLSLALPGWFASWISNGCGSGC
jgi:hypothetical protein